MIINRENLDLVFRGFKTVVTDAQIAAEVHWRDIAMTVPSSAASEDYGWLGTIPQLREWIGPREVHSLTGHGFTIRNRDFESTIAVRRNDITDDRLGVFKPAFAEMGRLARHHPEELIFGLLSSGFTASCFDGQPFFDAEHPVKKSDGTTELISNMQDGIGPAWYLLDTSRAVRPLIFQEREPYVFEAMTEPTNPHVFTNAEFLYGMRARVNVGFALWQLGFGSKANPVSLATIALTGGVAVLGQWALGINRAEDEARKTKERFETLADVIDALGDVSRASAADIDRYIRGTFNDVAGDVQALIDGLRQAEFGLLSTEMRHSIEETAADLSRLSGAFEAFWQDFAKGPNRIRASSFRPRPCARPWKGEMPGVWSA
ncbi:Mu-like prophage major head subunit gpT family protein [Rhodovulum sp. BSW8]|uniref:Mu-like prophage major head subunit gpT family protein n=1 Tax=Rhodovulum sp. BSW8 TaxID=2259645 RepID=UPI00140383FF|nr:Mu-like prophage major head subunit gpT family protein [Rhodovulum sp. BSW8]